MPSIPNYFNQFGNKKLLLLGFGKEGASTYQLLRRLMPPNFPLTIADGNEQLLKENTNLALDKNLSIIAGARYKDTLNEFDVIFKSPGVPLITDGIEIATDKLLSQTQVFLNLFSAQTIGITGTKGKSTTTSLIYHIISAANKNTALVGNIGIPAFDRIDKIDSETRIVFELSCLQLEHINRVPHIAILLNLFQEHLDYFHQLDAYFNAKYHIGTNQLAEDYFIYNTDNVETAHFVQQANLQQHLIPISLHPLPFGCFVENNKIVFKSKEGEKNIYALDEKHYLIGQHNVYNILAASAACICAGISTELIAKGIRTFKGLPHRLEYVGKFKDIHFYNDSISTIPEATIEALKSLKEVDTLILGGKDRGIDYQILIDFISQSTVRNLVFIGDAGQRIRKSLIEKNSSSITLTNADCMQQAVDACFALTQKNKICLLSPAAASYGMFKNFEDRGAQFKMMVKRVNG